MNMMTSQNVGAAQARFKTALENAQVRYCATFSSISLLVLKALMSSLSYLILGPRATEAARNIAAARTAGELLPATTNDDDDEQ